MSQPRTSIAPAIRVDGLTKRFGSFTAVDDVSFTVQTEPHLRPPRPQRRRQDHAHAAAHRPGLRHPRRRSASSARSRSRTPRVLQNICFIKESQRYPDDFMPKHVFRSAPWFFENWDADFADRLIDDFRLPLNRRIKKLSRGQLSAVGVIVGLASRAPLTFFDEPYLGLDAVARQIFYDRLLEDYSEHPRTVVLSTHLIDEVANLLEHVLVIDQGRILIDDDAETLPRLGHHGRRHRAAPSTRSSPVARCCTATASAASHPSPSARSAPPSARKRLAAGLELSPVSLQQLIVRKTNVQATEFEQSA